MAKKLTAKVNGVKVKDGETVTLVVRAVVEIHQGDRFDGTSYKYVAFDSDPKGESGDDSVYLETGYLDKNEEGAFEGLTIIRDKS